MEKNTKKTFSITTENTNSTELNHTAFGIYGGVYEITVSTNVPNALKTSSVMYYAPPISPPLEFDVVTMDNGSYFINWLDRKPATGGPYRYQLFVSTGNMLNEKIAQTIEVDRPPCIYTNTSFDTFSFAVRISTNDGYKSEFSEIESRRHLIATAEASISETSFVAIIVPIVLLLLVVGSALAIFYIRYKNLHNKFTRFGNSHYDTRSEAATFDDDTLEEDDSPQIQGFAADEPLVIA